MTTLLSFVVGAVAGGIVTWFVVKANKKSVDKINTAIDNTKSAWKK